MSINTIANTTSSNGCSKSIINEPRSAIKDSLMVNPDGHRVDTGIKYALGRAPDSELIDTLTPNGRSLEYLARRIGIPLTQAQCRAIHLLGSSGEVGAQISDTITSNVRKYSTLSKDRLGKMPSDIESDIKAYFATVNSNMAVKLSVLKLSTDETNEVITMLTLIVTKLATEMLNSLGILDRQLIPSCELEFNSDDHLLVNLDDALVDSLRDDLATFMNSLIDSARKISIEQYNDKQSLAAKFNEIITQVISITSIYRKAFNIYRALAAIIDKVHNNPTTTDAIIKGGLDSCDDLIDTIKSCYNWMSSDVVDLNGKLGKSASSNLVYVNKVTKTLTLVLDRTSVDELRNELVKIQARYTVIDSNNIGEFVRHVKLSDPNGVACAYLVDVAVRGAFRPTLLSSFIAQANPMRTYSTHVAISRSAIDQHLKEHQFDKGLYRLISKDSLVEAHVALAKLAAESVDVDGTPRDDRELSVSVTKSLNSLAIDKISKAVTSVVNDLSDEQLKLIELYTILHTSTYYVKVDDFVNVKDNSTKLNKADVYHEDISPLRGTVADPDYVMMYKVESSEPNFLADAIGYSTNIGTVAYTYDFRIAMIFAMHKVCQQVDVWSGNGKLLDDEFRKIGLIIPDNVIAVTSSSLGGVVTFNQLTNKYVLPSKLSNVSFNDLTIKIDGVRQLVGGQTTTFSSSFKFDEEILNGVAEGVCVFGGGYDYTAFRNRILELGGLVRTAVNHINNTYLSKNPNSGTPNSIGTAGVFTQGGLIMSYISDALPWFAHLDSSYKIGHVEGIYNYLVRDLYTQLVKSKMLPKAVCSDLNDAMNAYGISFRGDPVKAMTFMIDLWLALNISCLDSCIKQEIFDKFNTLVKFYLGTTNIQFSSTF